MISILTVLQSWALVILLGLFLSGLGLSPLYGLSFGFQLLNLDLALASAWVWAFKLGLHISYLVFSERILGTGLGFVYELGFMLHELGPE